LAVTPVLQQAAAAQQREVAGNLGLDLVQRRGQLAYAQFLLQTDQQRDTRTGFVGQTLE